MLSPIDINTTEVPIDQHVSAPEHMGGKGQLWNYQLHKLNDTLAQLMYTVGNVNNAVSIVLRRIFYSNYKKALLLTT